MKEKSRNTVNVWIAIGAVILIILLIVWLTIADFWHDTDVAAYNTLQVTKNIVNLITV